MLPTAPNPPVSVRVTTAEREMLEAAAAQARTNLSNFVPAPCSRCCRDGAG